jgi:hypothetical protein
MEEASMNSYRQRVKYFKGSIYFSLIVLFLCVGTGCTSTHKTTTTETTVNNPNEPVYSGTPSSTTETTTTTTDTETKAEHPGVLGATFHAIGYVLSLPFIVIGGVIKTIFGG